MMCVFIYAHFTVEYSVKVDLFFNKYLIHFMWYHCIYARSKTRNSQHVRTFCLQKLHIICVNNSYTISVIKVYTCTSNMYILRKCYFITVCCVFARVIRHVNVTFASIIDISLNFITFIYCFHISSVNFFI